MITHIAIVERAVTKAVAVAETGKLRQQYRFLLSNLVSGHCAGAYCQGIFRWRQRCQFRRLMKRRHLEVGRSACCGGWLFRLRLLDSLSFCFLRRSCVSLVFPVLQDCECNKSNQNQSARNKCKWRYFHFFFWHKKNYMIRWTSNATSVLTSKQYDLQIFDKVGSSQLPCLRTIDDSFDL